MSHLTSTRVAAMTFWERFYASAYRLGWRTCPGATTWDTNTTSIDRDNIRWLLWPNLEPSTLPDGPHTVYCSAGPYANGTATSTQVANAHASLTGLTRGGGESDFDLLGRCLQTEPVS